MAIVTEREAKKAAETGLCSIGYDDLKNAKTFKKKTEIKRKYCLACPNFKGCDIAYQWGFSGQ